MVWMLILTMFTQFDLNKLSDDGLPQSYVSYWSSSQQCEQARIHWKVYGVHVYYIRRVEVGNCLLVTSFPPHEEPGVRYSWSGGEWRSHTPSRDEYRRLADQSAALQEELVKAHKTWASPVWVRWKIGAAWTKWRVLTNTPPGMRCEDHIPHLVRDRAVVAARGYELSCATPLVSERDFTPPNVGQAR